MVYTSRPDYLDPPNWSQQLQTHQLIQQGNQTGRNGGSAGASSGSDPHQLLHHAPVPPRSDGGAAGLVRPGSMVDRARLAKIPLPEHNLKCPRCDSTNTKFCYFNNYSLSQPRHFCKTCRRYWTRGGALRNVPVGGGCRRSKRSKSGAASKSTSNDGKSGPTGSTTHAPQLGSGGGGAITTSGFVPPPQLPLLASLHSLSDYGAVQSIGLNYPVGIHQIDHTDYPVQNNAGSINPMALDHWRPLHQFPCFSDLEAAPPPLSTGLYAFNTEAGGDAGATPASLMNAGQIQAKPTCSSLVTQLASVKMEEGNPQGSNIPRQYLSLPPLGNNDPYWGGGGVTGGGGLSTGIISGGSGTSGVAWTDISGISSTSAGSLL